MKHFCPTIVIRHRKERLKKCSLRGLEGRAEITFYSYPLKRVPPIDNFVLLSLEAPAILSTEDKERGLLLLDGTWHLAQKMLGSLVLPKNIVQRALPEDVVTAYPRKQDEPTGLASVEALYIAYVLLGRDPSGLLDHYHWKELFLEKNRRYSIVNT